MKLTRRSSLADVAAAVATALDRSGIVAVLTGGACATIYSRGAYQSHDLDFIVTSGGTRKSLDAAMASVGFTRDGDRYLHAATPFFVEFPRGPLAIGDDVDIRPVELAVGTRIVPALSAKDACRDRLAAFYHWSDRQSLRVAVEIASAQSVNMKKIRDWSANGGCADRFEEFRRDVGRMRQAHQSTPTRARSLR